MFAHVPADFVTNSPAFREGFLKYWAERGFVRTVSHLPLVNRARDGESKTRRHMWVLVFKSKAAFRKYCGETAVLGKGIRELEHKNRAGKRQRTG